MSSLDPHSLGVLAMTAGVSFSMVWLAVKLNLLEHRPASKCPACGRLRRHGSCGC